MHVVLKQPELSDTDRAYSHQYAEVVYKRTYENGFVANYGAYGDGQADRVILQTYFGKLGDFAVARFLGTVPFGYPDTFPEHGSPDIVLPNGEVVEVKTTQYFGWNRFDLSSREVTSGNAYLCFYDRKTDSVWILAYVTNDDFFVKPNHVSAVWLDDSVWAGLQAAKYDLVRAAGLREPWHYSEIVA